MLDETGISHNEIPRTRHERILYENDVVLCDGKCMHIRGPFHFQATNLLTGLCASDNAVHDVVRPIAKFDQEADRVPSGGIQMRVSTLPDVRLGQ
jgi:hypothetical protein